ncbi:HAD family hydrolase [Candidatus Neomarinimicrobiota bacterium]
MTLLRPQVVIFDFDYTLADSSQGIVECVNYALSRLGREQISPARIRKTIGLSLPDTCLALTGRSDLGQEFTRLFILRADEVMADSTVIMDSASDTIQVLRQRGFRLGIVSTKFRRRIETILGREDLLEPFDVIVGGEDVAEFKPNPEGINLAMERLGCSPSNSIYVGDSLVDLETAKRAGLPFIALLTGPTTRWEFPEDDVYLMLERISDLPASLPDSL